MDIIDVIKYIEDNNYKNLDVLYRELINKININILNFIFFDRFHYIPTNILIKDINETYEQKIKRYDTKFKNDVKEYYKKCIITGRSSLVCEVAHIYPFSDSDYEDKYNPNNGILLCRDLHILFDKNLININNDFTLIISKEILDDESLELYHQYNNKKLNIKQESKYYLQKYNEFTMQCLI